MTVGSTAATLLSVSPGELIATAPPLADCVQNVSLTDPATGASSTLTGVLTFGAGPNDTIRLAQGANAATPVGAEAASPVRVTVSSSDGLTSVNGATVQWSATNGAGLSACNGAATCYVFTDESGQVETRVTIRAVGTTTITAALAPASYTPPKTVQVSIGGTSSAKDLAVFSPKVWVVQGTTLDVPLAARLLSNGVPLSGQTLNWNIGIGSGTLTPANAMTDGSGWPFHAARKSTRRRCARHGVRRAWQRSLPDVLRHPGIAFGTQAATGLRQLPDDPRRANLSADLSPRHKLGQPAKSGYGCAGFFPEHDLPARRGRACRDLRRRRQFPTRNEGPAGCLTHHID